MPEPRAAAAASPPSLATRPRLRLAFCCLLYVAQGIPYGFVTVALAGWLATHGAGEQAVGGIIALAVLPWSFKWAWGPLVDSGRCAVLGRRRPWLLLAQALMVLTSLMLLAAGPESTRLIGWLVLVHNVFVGLQDVAVDALAVDMLAGAERERASGLMYGASYVGTILGGAGLGIVVARQGLAAAIVTMAAVQAAMFLVVAAIRERPGADGVSITAPVVRPAALLRQLAAAMLAPPALRAELAALALKTLPAMLYVMMTVHMFRGLGWSQERFAEVSGGWGNALGLAAAVAAGFLAGRVGPRTTAIVANSILSALWLVLAAVRSSWEHPAVIVAWFAVETTCLAFLSVSMFAIFMRVSTPAVAATQFTASMALMNLATSLGSWLAGPVGAWLDAPGGFLVAGLLQPFGALLLPATTGGDRPTEPAAAPAPAGTEAGPPPGAALSAVPALIVGGLVMAAAVPCPAADQPPVRLLDTRALVERETFWDNRDVDWFVANVPAFECPDADIQTTWYYRWELLTKHLTYGSPDTGYVFTEFLDRPFWSGAYGAISCPAGHQLAEARWLRSPRVARDYSRYWVRTKGAQPRNYSTWLADAVWGVHLVHPAVGWLDPARRRDAADVFPTDILDGLEANARGWHERHFVAAQGLYWQVGHDDGMEFNIASRQTKDILRGAPSYRPSFNAYMWADLQALARLHALAGDEAAAAARREAAEALKTRMEALLWDEDRGFFLSAFRDDETLDGFTARANTRIYQTGRFAGSPHGRELIGYVPWQFDMPTPGRGYERAWKLLVDPEFFAADFGPTTVERHDPLFLLQPHCCWWSGQSWPYATTQTLKALATLLQRREQPFVTPADYVSLLTTYARTHRKNGRPYLAEACHPDTGSFAGHDAYNHSEHYFHSGYADLVVTGLVGLVPRDDDVFEVRPLFPVAWDYLCLDHVVYRGREVAVVWDRTGDRYGLGAGFHLVADGLVIASAAAPGPLTAQLPPLPASRTMLEATGLVDAGLRPGIAAQRVNVAVTNDGGYFPRITVESTAAGSSAGQLGDGVAWYLRTPPNRWVSAEPGRAATIEIDFGRPRRIDQVRLFVLDDDPALLAGTADESVGRDHEPSSVRPPERVEVDVWRDEEWVRVAAATDPVGHRSLTLGWEAGEATRLRVRLEPRPDCQVGLAELEAWGEAVLPLEVAPPPPGNLALNPGGPDAAEFPRARASHTSRYDTVAHANDGVVSFGVAPHNRWTSYESPAASDWLEIDFGDEQTVGRVELAIYDDRGGVQPPESYAIETWDGAGWQPVEEVVRVPERPVGGTFNVARFPPRRTTRLRVVFTHRGASRSGVSEILVWER